MADRRIISSDNHVIEPIDLWTSRVEPKYAWRAPHVEDLGDQGDFWVCDGRKIIGVTGGSDKVGVRFEDPDLMHTVGKTENVRPGGYDPDEHVKDLDIDGMDVSILYPTVGFMLYGLPDSELLDSLCKSYNDWVEEFCSANPKRLKGIAMFNVDDVGVGIKELERAHKMGFIGAMLAVYPLEGQFYNLPKYDDLWAASRGLGNAPQSAHRRQSLQPSPGIGRSRHRQARLYMQLGLLAAYVYLRYDFWRRFPTLPQTAGGLGGT